MMQGLFVRWSPGVKITTTGQNSYAPSREGAHNDQHRTVSLPRSRPVAESRIWYTRNDGMSAIKGQDSMSDQPQKPKSIAEDGKHPLYTVWYVQDRLHALDVALSERSKFDKHDVQMLIANFARMLDEWLTKQGITERR